LQPPQLGVIVAAEKTGLVPTVSQSHLKANRPAAAGSDDRQDVPDVDEYCKVQ